MANNDSPATGTSSTAVLAPGPSEAGGEPALAGQGDRRKWIVIGAIGLAFVLLVAYVGAGAVVASSADSKAKIALETTFSHQDAVLSSINADPFSGVQINSDNPDVKAMTAALTSYEPKLAQSLALVDADMAALQRVNLGGSFLTIPEQVILNADRHRVAAALSALASARQGLEISQKQAAFLHPFFDAVSAFEAIGNAAQTGDVVARLPGLEASVQKALDLALPADLPPQALTLVKGMQQTVNDLNSLIAAATANDAAGAKKYETALQADATTLSSYDEQAADNAEKALFAPLNDAYNGQMKVAAGG